MEPDTLKTSEYLTAMPNKQIQLIKRKTKSRAIYEGSIGEAFTIRIPVTWPHGKLRGVSSYIPGAPGEGVVSPKWCGAMLRYTVIESRTADSTSVQAAIFPDGVAASSWCESS